MPQPYDLLQCRKPFMADDRRAQHQQALWPRPPHWRLVVLVAFFLLCLFYWYSLLVGQGNRHAARRRPPPIRLPPPPTAPYPELRALNQMQTLGLIETRSNLAALYCHQRSQSNHSESSRLPGARYCPGIEMVPIHRVKQVNSVWQVLDLLTDQAKPFMLYIFSAHYDDRSGWPEVKIITSCSEQKAIESMQLGCLLWFDRQPDPVVSNVTEIYSIWPEYWDFGFKPGIFGPQIITCRVPEPYRNITPRAVSLLSAEPEPSVCSQKPGSKAPNVVRVDRNRNRSDLQLGNRSRNIGVCVHGFRFGTYDFSVRLVEWLELVRLMGAAKVYFYVYDATDGIYRIIEHYAKEGLVQWRRITFPGWQPNVESMYEYVYKQIGAEFWPEELIDVNDCLYRNLYRHDYIAEIDVDEMIVPQGGIDDWCQLIESLEASMSRDELRDKSFYLSHQAYVYEQWAEELGPHGDPLARSLYMMRHIHRAKPYQDGTNAKCFHRIDSVMALHSHFPMRCSRGGSKLHHNCNGLELDPLNQSLLMHFRSNREPDQNCTKGKTSEQVMRQCTIADRSLWKWLDPVRSRVAAKLAEIFGR